MGRPECHTKQVVNSGMLLHTQPKDDSCKLNPFPKGNISGGFDSVAHHIEEPTDKMGQDPQGDDTSPHEHYNIILAWPNSTQCCTTRKRRWAANSTKALPGVGVERSLMLEDFVCRASMPDQASVLDLSLWLQLVALQE